MHRLFELPLRVKRLTFSSALFYCFLSVTRVVQFDWTQLSLPISKQTGKLEQRVLLDTRRCCKLPVSSSVFRFRLCTDRPWLQGLHLWSQNDLSVPCHPFTYEWLMVVCFLTLFFLSWEHCYSTKCGWRKGRIDKSLHTLLDIRTSLCAVHIIDIMFRVFTVVVSVFVSGGREGSFFLFR